MCKSDIERSGTCKQKAMANNTTIAPYTKVNWYYSARFWLSFGLCGFLINVLEGFVVFYSKKQKTIFGVTLASLCIADILSGLCFFVVGLMRLVQYDGSLTIDIIPNTKLASSWQGGHGALFFSMGTSFTHVIIIAVQRFFAVFMPFRYRTSFRYKHCLVLLGTVWVLLLMSGIAGYFYVSVIWYASYVLTLTVCLTLIVTYTAIVVKTFRADKHRLSITSKKRVQEKEGNRASRKVLSLSIAVTIAFVLCTLPHGAFYLFERSNMTYYHIINSLISVNPFMDSVIYFSFYHKRGAKLQAKDTGLKAPLAMELTSLNAITASPVIPVSARSRLEGNSATSQAKNSPYRGSISIVVQKI